MMPKTATSDDDREQEPGLLEEGEVGALEVEAEVGGGERSDQERGQEGPDSDRRGDAETLKEGEEIVHGALAFVAAHDDRRDPRKGTTPPAPTRSSATAGCSRAARAG